LIMKRYLILVILIISTSVFAAGPETFMDTLNTAKSDLILDNFATPRAAGAIGGTTAEPYAGKGTRTIPHDTNGVMTISNGMLNFNGTAVTYNDPVMTNSTSITRQQGQIIYAKYMVAPGDYLGWTGVGQPSGSSNTNFSVYRTTSSSQLYLTWPLTIISPLLDNTWQEYITVLRTAGQFVYINNGCMPQLLFVEHTNTTTPLNIYTGRPSAGGITEGYSVSRLEAPTRLWTPPVLASDSFNRTNGAPGNTDGLGVPEPGGSGLAWTDISGTSVISGDKLTFSSLGSGLGMTLVNTGKSQVYTGGKIYWSSGLWELIVGYVDSNNYILVTYNGTNVVISTVIAGAAYTLCTSAQSYVAGAHLDIWITELYCGVWYNNTPIYIGGRLDGTGTNVANLTPAFGGTWQGFASTSTANAIANFYVFSEYQNIPFVPQMNNKKVAMMGDSKTQYVYRLAGALWQQLGQGWMTIDLAQGATGTAQMLARFPYEIADKIPSYPYVNIMAGQNDYVNQTAAWIENNLQQMYTLAHNAGTKVIACTDTPFKGNASWTSAQQAVQDAVRTWIMTEATNVDYVVDLFTVLEDPNNADYLLAAYDSGDGVHPSWAGCQAGAAAIASTVNFR